MKLVIIESPFAARKADGSWDAEGVEENLRYLRAAMRDCLLQGEAPYASHALYTQPGVLNDQVPDERKLGMESGFAWNERADYTVLYIDRGLSSGMKAGITNAVKAGRKILVRTLDGWDQGLRVGDIAPQLAELGVELSMVIPVK